MRKQTRFHGETDNSHYELKRDLRMRFADKVGADTCFDLFCGTGLLTSAIWAPRFGRVVCVDKSAKQLEDFRGAPNVDVYCGDNQKLFTGLVVRYGWPDVFDLDAYGYPDNMVHRIMLARSAAKPFAICATNGGMASRQRASENAVPISWGYGPKLTFAQYAAAMDATATCDYTHLREWAAEGGKTVSEFESATVGAMCYWAALIEPGE